MRIEISRLTECIMTENQVLTDLINLANSKKQAIILEDIAELTEIMRQESHLIHVLEKTEAQRHAGSVALARSVGLKEEELTASSLIDHLNASSEAARLSEAIDNLVHSLELLKEMNQNNTILLEQSLAFVENMEALLTRQRQTTYSAGGSVNDNPTRSVLDKKV